MVWLYHSPIPAEGSNDLYLPLEEGRGGRHPVEVTRAGTLYRIFDDGKYEDDGSSRKFVSDDVGTSFILLKG
jgi:hypothetical protein